ncbi:MAG: TIGR00730 family Rossman fold protein [Myxococcales bacterium]|nr:TIGR00730 family Rossman fold protein [Myxococcales bacterium]MCB9565681.1 TIGR00730 family Rossman fold protein [Myxococcales bacterium]MCB9703163.1 TIGR00730 family Rossman fold protein [Myxococcales bacterium]
MRSFRRICIYCGSASGDDPIFGETARAVGAALAGQGIGVVYGGGRIGLMGLVADAALDAGGEVYGVIPHKLQELEVAHGRLTELFVVDSMHARKMVMAQLADAFIALPGGFGTLDELFEVTTWTQLGYHQKPVGILNVAGYFDHLLRFVDHAASRGFIRGPHRGILHAADSIDELLAAMASATIPDLRRTLGKIPPAP